MKRDLTIDILKGIGIVLVVLGHTLSSNLTTMIYLFHMPLFFFVSGMSSYYSYNNRISFKEYFIKKGKTILTPYFIFSLIIFLYWFIIERKIRNQLDISALKNLINIFIAFCEQDLFSPNVVMWFLPCLFISLIIFFILMKLKKMKNVVAIILLIIGFLLSYYKILLPWAIETSLIASFFVYTGYYYKKITKDNKSNKSLLIEILIAIIAVIFCYKYNGSIAMLNHKYNNILLFLLGAYAGIILILNISKFINKSTKNKLKNLLCYLGKNSIIIMICHEPLKRIIIKLYSTLLNLNIDIVRESIFHSLILTLIIIVAITPITYIINNYVPFLIGKSKKTKKE